MENERCECDELIELEVAHERLKNTLMEAYLHFHCGDETYSDSEMTERMHNDLCNEFGSDRVTEFVDARMIDLNPMQEPLHDDAYTRLLKSKQAAK